MIQKQKDSKGCATGSHVDSSHGGMYRSSWHPAFSIWFQLHVQLKSALRHTKPREEVGRSVTLIPHAQDHFFYWKKLNARADFGLAVCVSPCTYGLTTATHLNTGRDELRNHLELPWCIAISATVSAISVYWWLIYCSQINKTIKLLLLLVFQ